MGRISGRFGMAAIPGGRRRRRYRGRRAGRTVVTGLALGVALVLATQILDMQPLNDWIAAPGGESVSLQMPLCGSAVRINCVVDGDTIWVSGEKIRIADIDTPEIFSPHCASEKARGEQATARLVTLLNQAPFELVDYERKTDRYGRSLKIVMRNGRSIGGILVAEGLARQWDGARRDWCSV